MLPSNSKTETRLIAYYVIVVFDAYKNSWVKYQTLSSFLSQCAHFYVHSSSQIVRFPLLFKHLPIIYSVNIITSVYPLAWFIQCQAFSHQGSAVLLQTILPYLFYILFINYPYIYSSHPDICIYGYLSLFNSSYFIL